MPVVAAAGQPLGGYRALFGTGGGLDDLEEREPHRLLQLVVAVDLDVGAIPDVVEIVALLAAQAVPAVRFAADSAAST